MTAWVLSDFAITGSPTRIQQFPPEIKMTFEGRTEGGCKTLRNRAFTNKGLT